MNGKRLIAMGLIVTLSVSAAACGKEEESTEVSKAAVEVLNPSSGEVTVDTAYIGTVTPQEQVYVIPKTSGTVTDTFFEVGDTVQEGDVLFKIDDEAAQLQLASARAAYDTAEAGVVAQNGGARDLQNYQTERQIEQLRDTLNDTDDTISDMEDNLGDVRDAAGKISDALNQAKAGADQLNQLQVSQTAELLNLQKALEDATSQVKSSAEQELREQNPEISDEDLAAAIEEAVSGNDQIKQYNTDIELANGKIAETQLQLNEANSGVTQLQNQLDSLNATKTQLKSGIDQAEDGMDTIRDNLTTAEQAYAITQNEIYPQTDAAGAAQLSQVAVGIDSAQMQLDFCTVTSPISGVVESVSVEKNGMAAAGSPAYIISNKESMTVTFHVAEKAKNVLQVGDHVTVDRNGATYDGTITEIGTMAGQQTRLFQVKATVTGAGDALPNGVSVKVYATTERESSSLIIPYDALYFAGGEAYVYCVEGEQIVRKDVIVGLMSDTEAVIEEGISADSLVVDSWSSKLRDGVEVEITSINGEASAEPESELTEENAEESESEMTEEENTEETTEESDTAEEAE